MKEGSRFCQNCPLWRDCHPQLIPEHITRDGKIGVIPNHFKRFGASFCRHFTCNDLGVEAARQALSFGNFSEYALFNGKTVLAAPFGSTDKPTQNGLRIIDKQGNVYSMQNNVYYPTGYFLVI